MTSHRPNRVRAHRTARGWSQAQLAERTGVSRTAISAIEGRRLVPSVAAALALAEAFGTSVEDLFGDARPSSAAAWAVDPSDENQPYWQAEVGGRVVRYPAQSAPMVTPLPDATPRAEPEDPAAGARANLSLVLAGCDPAAGFLADLFARTAGMRLLNILGSSARSLDLLRRRLVHVAGVHFSTVDDPDCNALAARKALGGPCRLLRLARWQEGIALRPTLKLKSVGAALRSRLTWVGREPGSGARQCLDRLNAAFPPRRSARHHRGVAEAIQSGWADAGVCVRLVSAEAQLDFLPVQEETYDLCIPEQALDDRRVRALISVVRSREYRTILSSLPGYNATDAGELIPVR